MDLGRFLCRDEGERRRITDMGRALRPGTPFLIALFMLAGLSGVPAYGLAPLIPPSLAIAVYGAMWLGNMPRRAHPEQAYAAALVLGELMLALAIVLGHGPQRGYLMILTLPVLVAAVVFPKRVVIAAVALGVVLMVGLSFTVVRSETLAVPAVAYAPVFVLIALVSATLVVRELEDASRRTALVDELTRALKRTALPARLAELAHQAAGGRFPVGAIVSDIDHFKAINDEHGHVAGDAVLREVVRRLSDCLGAFESVYRYGGEEFVILLGGHGRADAEEVALRMWHAIREAPIGDIRVTMSFGVAASSGERLDFDFDSLFERADEALYAAKRGGRDLVRTAGELWEGEPDRPATGVAVLGTGTGTGSARALGAGAHAPGAPAEVGRLEPVGWTRGSRGPLAASWKVTEDLERKHILEFIMHLRGAFALIAGGAFVLIAGASPWFGWQPLIPPVAGAVLFLPIMQGAARVRYPDRLMFSAMLGFQASIALGFALADGAPLFALTLMTLMMPGCCATLRGRQAIALTAGTALMMVGVAFDLASSQVLDAPSLVLFPLALLVEASYVGWMVGHSAIGHRGAGILDELTGLLNRAALAARVLELGAHTGSSEPQVGMLLIDLDNFKQVNDRHGHATGDLVLRAASARIRASLRMHESAYRVGGEEVLVLLPNADARSAHDVAERLRVAVGGSPCGGVAVTISVGVGVTEPGERFNYEEVVRRADGALYMAKRLGRNRVCVGSAPAGKPSASPLPALSPFPDGDASDQLMPGGESSAGALSRRSPVAGGRA